MNAIRCHTLLLSLGLTLSACPAPTSTSPPPAVESTPKAAPPKKAPPKGKTNPSTHRPPAGPVRAAAPTDKLRIVRTSGSVEGPLPYLIVEPARAPADTPLVIALHGRGDTADGFARLAERLRMPLRFIVAQAPMPWGMRDGRRWFDMRSPELRAQLTQRVTDLTTLASQVAKRWPEAPPPYLMGFSQGAMLSLQAIAERPGPFAGAIALSGALLSTEGLPKASEVRPVLLTGGATDRVVPAKRARDAEATLKTLGHRTELVIFEGGHSVTPEVVNHIRRVLDGWRTEGGKPATHRGKDGQGKATDAQSPSRH